MFPLEKKMAIIRRDLWKKSDYRNMSEFSIFKRQSLQQQLQRCNNEKTKCLNTWLEIFLVAIFWIRVFRGEFTREEFNGWEFSGWEFFRGVFLEPFRFI